MIPYLLSVSMLLYFGRYLQQKRLITAFAILTLFTSLIYQTCFGNIDTASLQTYTGELFVMAALSLGSFEVFGLTKISAEFKFFVSAAICVFGLFYSSIMVIANINYLALFIVSSAMLYLLNKQKKVLYNDNFGAAENDDSDKDGLST